MFPLTRKVPALNSTTCPVWQLLKALWIAEVASLEPFP
jgi:hypothetical protein